MTIGTMISMEMPGVASYIGACLINIIYFDLFFTDRWINKLYVAKLNFESGAN
jgi:hypothetical protein